MPYHITHFGTVPLPIGNPHQDHTPAVGRSSITETLSGYYDHRKGKLALAQLQNISVRGLYWGEVEYWVDETGDRIVDETGDPIIFGNVVQMLRTQIDALAATVLTRDKLWRLRFDDYRRQWKTARFLEMSFPQTYEDRLFKAELALNFETHMDYWHEEGAINLGAGAYTGTPALMSVSNSGLVPITDPQLVFQCSFGNITSISITSTPPGVDLNWTGSLSAGQWLWLECGEEPVPTGTKNMMDGLRMGPGHTVAGWLKLPLGMSNLHVLTYGGNAAVNLIYHNQFP